ncbi:MAG: GspH/FimT family pseudopilin [Lysobacterales bacterium]
MRRSHHGFTLIEATLAMAVAAISLGVAIPSLTGAVSAAHAGTAKAAMVETFAKALTHSTATGVEVVLCLAASGSDACLDSTDWSDGWIAFADLDGNRSRGPNETLLLRRAAFAHGVHLRSTSGRKRLVFQPQGGAAGSNVTFTLCDSRGAAKATTAGPRQQRAVPAGRGRSGGGMGLHPADLKAGACAAAGAPGTRRPRPNSSAG